jgi:hypothetical protein|tara:strand:+ start:74 stop:664 length:591 start_codon:yes stop_codon:yes gene_type:complete
MNTEIYKRIIQTIYNKIDDEQILDIIHSTNDDHIKCKEWLASELQKSQIYFKDPKILVGGGWTGLMAHLLSETFKNASSIISVDLLQHHKDIGKEIFPHIKFDTNNVFEYSLQDFDIFVSTSVEHVNREELQFFLQNKPVNVICALQSNNWYDIEDHTNCSDTLEEFIEYLPLKKIMYSGSKKIRNTYDRFLVIGQ